MDGRVAPTPIAPNAELITTTLDNHLTYEIVKSGTLHTVDLSRSIKSELFSPRFVAAWNKTTRRLRYVFAVSHNVVHVLVVIMFAIPPDIGRAIAIAVVPLGIPGCVATLLALRYDILYVLTRTYDFWFFWVVTVITCTCLAFFLNDVRATGSFFIAIGMLICIIVDASTSLSRVFSFSTAAGGIMGLIVTTFVHLGLIPDANELKITYNARTISLGDVIANGLLTLVILLARNAYRRKQAVRHTTAHHSSICCITYRCAVKLELVSPQATETVQRRRNFLRTSTVPRFQFGSHTPLSIGASELRLVPIQEKIDGRRYILGRFDSIRPWPLYLRCGIWTTAIVTILMASFLFVYETILGRTLHWHLHVIVCTVSGAICATMFAYMQPQLLRTVMLSFDCAFVSIQLAVLHACGSDIFGWDNRALVLLVAYVWIHFVLATDALAPHTRRCIGFSRSFSTFVVAIYGSGISLFLAKLVFDTDWDLYDRVLMDRALFGRRLRVRVVPMIFSRLPLMICWSFRLVWRIYKSKDGELILIQGAVAYDRPTRK